MIQGLALDIDDILANTDYDRFIIMRELFGDPGFEFRDLSKHYERINYVWKSDDAQDWINKTIHDNEWQKNLSLFPDALDTVWEIHKRKHFLCYITGRPESVLTGTRERLKKYKFPDLPVIAKPLEVPKAQEHLWKAGQLYNLYAEGVTGIIDDQVKLLYQMTQHYPDYQGIVHIIGSTYPIETHIKHTVSSSWEELRKKILG